MMDNPKAPRSESFFNCEFLPIEIIIEILSRVPVKVLGRLTTVCKSWYSIISSEMFIHTHLKNYCMPIANGHNTSNKSPNIFLMPSYIKELEKYSYSLFSDNTFVKIGTFAVPMLYSWLELLFVGNSCNGIICFTDQKAFFGRKVFLYNPFIRKIKVISHDCFADSVYDRRRVYSKLGFGFSERNNDHKVVRIHYVKDGNLKMLGKVPPQAEVYSLKADCWRRITADIKCIVHHRSVSCNGAMYWLARRRDRWGCDTILSFDVANEVFCEIALPTESNSFIDGTILVFKGLLAFCKDVFSNRDDGVKCYELWVMMEYKVTDSWRKLSTLETHQPVSKVIGFTNCGKLIMQMDCGTLASWDPLNSQLEILKIDGFLNHVDAAFVESLVLYGEESIALADAMLMLIGSSSSMGIVKPRDLHLNMGHMIVVHGDGVMVRVAGDAAMVGYGVNELKNLCRRRPALVVIMTRPQSFQLCMQNYCLVVQQHRFDRAPQYLKDFLANPAICFINVDTDKSHLGPFNFENGIHFHYLVRRALNRRNIRGLELKSLAAEIGVALDEFSAGSFLEGNAEFISEAKLKLAIHQIYACYKIGYQLLSLLNVSF